MRYILFALSLSLTSAVFASEVKVGVKGMVCAFCAHGIEKKFKAQEEVDSINVSLENKFITIKYKDGKTLPQEKITQLLKDSGYEAVFEK